MRLCPILLLERALVAEVRMAQNPRETSESTRLRYTERLDLEGEG